MGMCVDAFVGFGVDLGETEQLDESLKEKLEELWGKNGIGYTDTGYDSLGQTVVYASRTVESVEWGDVAELDLGNVDTVLAQNVLNDFFDAVGLPRQPGKWLLWATYG